MEKAEEIWGSPTREKHGYFTVNIPGFISSMIWNEPCVWSHVPRQQRHIVHRRRGLWGEQAGIFQGQRAVPKFTQTLSIRIGTALPTKIELEFSARFSKSIPLSGWSQPWYGMNDIDLGSPDAGEHAEETEDLLGFTSTCISLLFSSPYPCSPCQEFPSFSNFFTYIGNFTDYLQMEFTIGIRRINPKALQLMKLVIIRGISSSGKIKVVSMISSCGGESSFTVLVFFQPQLLN